MRGKWFIGTLKSYHGYEGEDLTMDDVVIRALPKGFHMLPT